MTCTKCGTSFAETDKFCEKCGAARPATESTAIPQNFCNRCGGTFAATDMFCPKCGASRVQSPNQATASSMTHSTSSPPPTSAAQYAAPDPLPQSRQTLPSAQSPYSAGPHTVPQMGQAKKSSSKFIIAVGVLISLFALSAVAGIAYVGFRVKKKADEIHEAAKRNDETSLLRAITGKSGANQDISPNSRGEQASKGEELASLVKALGGASGENQPGNSSSNDQSSDTGSALTKLAGDGAEALMKKMMGASSSEVHKLPEWKTAPTDLMSSPAAKIPLRVSLHLVVVGTEPARGDYESIFDVDSVTDKQIHIAAHQQFPNPPDPGRVQAQYGPGGSSGSDPDSPAAARKINCGQTEFKADLENSAQAGPYFCMQGREDKFPGTTSLGFSKRTFADLKAGRDSAFIAYENPMNAFFKSFRDLVSGSGDPAEFLSRVFSAAPGAAPPPTPAIHYTLRRVGADIAFPVLVNNQPVELPAVHAICLRSDGTNDGDMYILDDANNPLILAGQTKPNGTAQTVKIYWDSDAPQSNPIEDQLRKEGRAKIYGIYFDFGSNQLRAESEPVLKEIAQAMKAHPDWNLRIEGHTDNIGGDAYNRNLSSNRAEAVKKALTSGYSIGESRLTTEGFGDTRPAAGNDTLEGRALNRRVELVRD